MARSEAWRFNRRQWGRRLRSARPWLLTVGGVGVLLVAAWGVFFSSLLATQTVAVTGTSIVTEAQVVKAASVDIGTPLARVNLDSVKRNVAAISAVAGVTVHRSWPHTLQITVTERKPLASVPQHGSWLAMDKNGVLFRPTATREARLPVVVLAASADATARHEVASVVSSLPADLLTKTRRVRARSMDSITLSLVDGRQVTWGSATESDRKVQVLAILLKQHASSYDVSVPEQPTTR